MSVDNRPMREPSYFILAALLDEPLHGYAIIKRVAELSAGRVRLAAGTLYTALDRLAAEGLLTVVTEEVVNGRARRYYGLTQQGDAAVPPKPSAWPPRRHWSRSDPGSPGLRGSHDRRTGPRSPRLRRRTCSARCCSSARRTGSGTGSPSSSPSPRCCSYRCR